MTRLLSYSPTQRFSSAAHKYNDSSFVQRQVALRLYDFFPPFVSQMPLLEVGCGTGHLTRLISERNPQVHLDAIDISEAMVSVARRVCTAHKNISFRVADVFNYTGDKPYGMIVSSSALHWTHSLGECFKHLASMLLDNGHLACAIMIKGTLEELHESRRRVAPHKLPLSELPSAEQLLTDIGKAGFEILNTSEDSIEEQYVSSAAFLRSIHDQGVTGGMFSRSATPLTRGELQRLNLDYEKHYGTGKDKEVKATYRVLYVLARISRDMIQSSVSKPSVD